MAGESVVFFGNCQAGALAVVYRLHFAPARDQTVHHINAQASLKPIDQSRLDTADIVVVQQFDFQSKSSAETIRPGARRYTFPWVVAGWQWPFASQAHPLNEPLPCIPEGPYPAELGDRFLNRMILERVPEVEALQRYLALDVDQDMHLDRLFETNLRRQQRRDEACGFEIARLIEANMRTQRLFLTPNHPDLLIFNELASGVFDRLGIPHPEITAALGRLRATPFPKDVLPTHPSVAAHFQMETGGAAEACSYLDEGFFTFAEYVRRYMRCEWNRALREGIFMAASADPGAALEKLDRGLAVSPRSAAGLRAKSTALNRLGRTAEAEDVLVRSIEFEPHSPDGYIALAILLVQGGRLAEAETVIRHAVAKDPEYAVSRRILADVLAREWRIAEALREAELAVVLAPGDHQNQAMLGRALMLTTDFAAAEQPFRRAVKYGGGAPVYDAMLSDALARQGRTGVPAPISRPVGAEASSVASPSL